MAWKELKGFRYPYRISEEGEIQSKRTGEWKTVHIIARKTAHSVVPHVQMAIFPKGHKKYSLTSLMEGIWLPVRGKGQVYIHKNGSSLDCSVYNIKLGTLSESAKRLKGPARKVVAKIDRMGKVIELYRSCAEAARKNHVEWRQEPVQRSMTRCFYGTPAHRF